MTIEQLAELIQKEQREVIARRYSQRQADAEVVEVVPGPKYTKVNRGPRWGPGRSDHNMSGFLMIENATGEIYGIRGYGQVNKKRHYGNLADAASLYWGEYSPEQR